MFSLEVILRKSKKEFTIQEEKKQMKIIFNVYVVIKNILEPSMYN